jgi:transposase
VVLSWDERNALHVWARRPPENRASLSLRARIVLLYADGCPTADITQHLGITDATATKWRRRYLDGGIEALRDSPRSGVPRSITVEQVEAVITATIEERPPTGSAWTTRSMAARMGIGASSVGRIWRSHGLQPDRLELFGLSSDPTFVERVHGMALYLKPPQGVLALLVVPAPVRTENSASPVRRDRVDAHRVTLMADLHEGLELAANQEIPDELAKEYERRRNVDLRRLFRVFDELVPTDFEVRMILDHSTTEVTNPIHEWLLKHLRFSVDYAPTWKWWLRLVEEWLTILVDQDLGWTLEELIVAIDDWMETFGKNAKPFVWYNGLPVDLRPESIPA